MVNQHSPYGKFNYIQCNFLLREIFQTGTERASTGIKLHCISMVDINQLPPYDELLIRICSYVNMDCMKKMQEISTPCFVVDKLRVKKNCDRMAEICKRLNLQLRPMMKTHKCVWVDVYNCILDQWSCITLLHDRLTSLVCSVVYAVFLCADEQ